MMLAADHAASAGVPLVCVKVGRTDEGTSMARSHTGHLTGLGPGHLRRVPPVRRDPGRRPRRAHRRGRHLLPDRAPRPTGRATERRVCVYAISGGTGAHMADLRGRCRHDTPGPHRADPEGPAQPHPGLPAGHQPGRLRRTAQRRTSAASTSCGRSPRTRTSTWSIVPITGALATMSVPLRPRHRHRWPRRPTSRSFVVWGSPTWDDVYEQRPAARPGSRCSAPSPTASRPPGRGSTTTSSASATAAPFAKLPTRPVSHRGPGGATSWPARRALAEHEAQGRCCRPTASRSPATCCAPPPARGGPCRARSSTAGSGVVMKVPRPTSSTRATSAWCAVGVDRAVGGSSGVRTRSSRPPRPRPARAPGSTACSCASWPSRASSAWSGCQPGRAVRPGGHVRPRRRVRRGVRRRHVPGAAVRPGRGPPHDRPDRRVAKLLAGTAGQTQGQGLRRSSTCS